MGQATRTTKLLLDLSERRYVQQRLSEQAWEHQSPLLFLRAHSAALHFPQTREIAARKVRESKLDPDLVTVAVDLNVKHLAVITVRRNGTIIDTIFVKDHGLDLRRYHHLKRIAKKQWQSGKPVKGEHSSKQLWQHVRRMNEDAAHKVARSIASVCARYPGCVLLFERLRKIKAKGASKSARLNRKQANQLRGKINQKDTPPKTGRPGRSHRDKECGTTIVGPKGACSSLHALADMT